MGNQLIEHIIEAFQTPKYLYYSQLLDTSEVVTLLPEQTSNLLQLKKSHWEEFLNKKSAILDDIFSWYKNDEIYDYFFPAILIYCIKSCFEETEVLLSLTEKLTPSFFKGGDCSYFPQMANFNTRQLTTFSDFLKLFKVEAPLQYDRSYVAAELAINWINKKNALLDKMILEFGNDNAVFYSNIADKITEEGELLHQCLNQVSWCELVKNEKILETIIGDYLFLFDEAFCYFMPACITVTLKNIFKEYPYHADVPFHTLSNLTRASTKEDDKQCYSYFTVGQRMVIKDFLMLVLELGSTKKSSEMAKRIESSLEVYWR